MKEWIGRMGIARFLAIALVLIMQFLGGVSGGGPSSDEGKIRYSRIDSLPGLIVEYLKANPIIPTIITSVAISIGIVIALQGNSWRKVSFVLMYSALGMLIALNLSSMSVPADHKFAPEDLKNLVLVPMGIGVGAGVILGLISCFLLRPGMVVLGALAGYLVADFAIANYSPGLADSYKIVAYVLSALVLASIAIVSLDIVAILITSICGAFFILFGVNNTTGDNGLLLYLLSNKLFDSAGLESLGRSFSENPPYKSENAVVRWSFVMFLTAGILGIIVQSGLLFRQRRSKSKARYGGSDF